MNRKTKIQIILYSGAPIVWGFAAIFGWFYKIDQIVKLGGFSTPLYFNAALGFIISGILLFFHYFSGHLIQKMQIFLGSLLIGYFGLIAVEDIFNVNLGINQFLVEKWLNPSHIVTGSTTVLGSMLFVCVGVVSILFFYRSNKIISWVNQSIIFFILIISTCSIVGYFLHLETIFALSEYTRMAFITSVLFFIMSIGLYGVHKNRHFYDEIEQNANDLLIPISAILVFSVMLVGLCGFAIMVNQYKHSLDMLLKEQLSHIVLNLQNETQTTIKAVDTINSVNLLSNDKKGITELHLWSDKMMKNISGILVKNAKGKELFKIGAFIEPSVQTFPSSSDDSLQLLWNQRKEIVLRVSKKFAGNSLIAEYPLHQFARDLLEKKTLFVGPMVCRKVDAEHGSCLSSKSFPNLESVFKQDAQREFTLIGNKSSTQQTGGYDFQNRHYFAAYTYLSEFDVNIFYIIDLYSLFSPVFSTVIKIIPTILLIILLGVLVLYRHIAPVLHAIVHSEKQALLHEKQLTASEAKFRSILEAAPYALFLVNEQGKIVMMNNTSQTIFGYSREELLGQEVEVLVPEDKRSKHDFYRKEYQKNPKPRLMGSGLKLFARKKNGELFPVDIMLTSVVVGEKESNLTLVTLRDCTAIRESEKHLNDIVRFQQTLLDSASYSIISCNAEGIITTFNKTAEIYLGYKAEEVIGKSPILFHDKQELKNRALELSRELNREVKPDIEVFIAHPRLHGSEIREWMYIRKDGTRFPIMLSVSLLYNELGEMVGGISIGTDISSQKALEHKNFEANQKLRASLDELNYRNAQLLLIKDLISVLQTCYNVKEAAKTISGYCEKLLPNSSGCLYLSSLEYHWFELVLTWGKVEGAEKSFSNDDCWALRRGKSYRFYPEGNNMLCKHLHKQKMSSHVHICTPLLAQSQVIGLLYIESEIEVKNGYKELIIETLSEQMALGLSNILLREKMHEQSIRDPLTNLYNRRYLDDLLVRELFRAERDNEHLAIIMLDIDYFKKFNDDFGHEVGDMVLKEIAKTLLLHLRKVDIVCRYGGEEFILVLLNLDAAMAFKLAEKIRISVHELRIFYDNQEIPRISLSGGISTYPEAGKTTQELIVSADRMLYEAKRRGRDRIISTLDD